MPQYQAPDRLPDWAESSSALATAPTPSQQASGFSTNQRPTPNTLNWLFRQLGRSVRWLSQGVNAVLIGAVQEVDWRLVGGGQWSWQASTGTLAWSSPVAIVMPGLSESANTFAAGSVALTAGQVAYVPSNTPFSTTGDVTSGSAIVANLAYESGIAVGMSVSGKGIAANTTVAALSSTDSTLTLSSAATSSFAATQLVFATTGPLVVKAADVASFVPSANTVVIANCIADAPNFVMVGVNASYMRLLDGESKALLGNGYVGTMRATAGAALSARQPVYISSGAADGRTAGYAYPLDVSATSTVTRATFAGFSASATASGDVAQIVMSGRVSGYSNLVPGTTYYGNPTNSAILQPTKPTATGQYVVALGAAGSANTLVVAPVPSPVVQAIGSTTTFSGPVSAPSILNTAGFRSRVALGAYLNTNYGGGTVTTYQSVFEQANSATYACNFCWIPEANGSVVGLSISSSYFLTGTMNMAVVQPTGGSGAGATLLQLNVAMTSIYGNSNSRNSLAYGYAAFTKGQYNFVAGIPYICQLGYQSAVPLQACPSILVAYDT